jgi:hypothetical protein
VAHTYILHGRNTISLIAANYPAAANCRWTARASIGEKVLVLVLDLICPSDSFPDDFVDVKREKAFQAICGG